jgi:hypothetical protein
MTHGGSGVGVAGGDLDVAQVHARVETGRDERMPEHVRMRPGEPHTRVLRESAEPPGACMTVHACSTVVEQDRAGRSAADGAVDSLPDRRGQRDQDHLAALAADSQHPVTVLFAEITDICAGGFEDPQARRPSMATKAKSLRLADSRAGVSRAAVPGCG